MIDQKQENIYLQESFQENSINRQNSILKHKINHNQENKDQQKLLCQKLSVQVLTKILNQNNKALIGRIMGVISSENIKRILQQVNQRVENGAIDNKASIFLKLIKQNLNRENPELLKFIFNKKSKTLYPQEIIKY